MSGNGTDKEAGTERGPGGSPTSVVHVVRHGEVYNPDKILYGRLPGFHLSDLGVAQAQRTAEFLARRDIGYLVCSPMERALQTVAPLAALTGLQVHQDERLIEAANHFQGRAYAGHSTRVVRPANLFYLRNPITPSWGEPYAQIAARMLAAVLDARDAAAGHEAVCVTHQLPVVALRRLVAGQRLWHDPRKRICALASVTSLTLEGDRVVHVDYAEPAGVTPTGDVAGA